MREVLGDDTKADALIAAMESKAEDQSFRQILMDNLERAEARAVARAVHGIIMAGWDCDEQGERGRGEGEQRQ